MARTTTTTRVRTTPYSLDKAKRHTKSKPTLTPDIKDRADILSREDRKEALETDLKGGKERSSGGYDKHRLVLLVIKVSPAPLRPLLVSHSSSGCKARMGGDRPTGRQDAHA